MRDQNLPPPMTNILNGVITSTLSSWGIKIRKAGHQLRANVQVAANKFSKFSVSLAYKLYPPSGIVQPVPHFNILQSRISWTISPKTVAYLPIGSMYGIYIYMVTFTINIPQMLAYIYHTWILWVIVHFPWSFDMFNRIWCPQQPYLFGSLIHQIDGQTSTDKKHGRSWSPAKKQLYSSRWVISSGVAILCFLIMVKHGKK